MSAASIAVPARLPISHSEALRALGAEVQLTVLSSNRATPPNDPADGDRYIVPATAAGVWMGHGGKIALWQDGAWSLFTPLEGWVARVSGDTARLIFDGASWRPVA